MLTFKTVCVKIWKQLIMQRNSKQCKMKTLFTLQGQKTSPYRNPQPNWWCKKNT